MKLFSNGKVARQQQKQSQIKIKTPVSEKKIQNFIILKTFFLPEKNHIHKYHATAKYLNKTFKTKIKNRVFLKFFIEILI